MRRVAVAALLLLAGFVVGAIAMLELLDRLFGGSGIRIERAPAYPAREPWGDA